MEEYRWSHVKSLSASSSVRIMYEFNTSMPVFIGADDNVFIAKILFHPLFEQISSGFK